MAIAGSPRELLGSMLRVAGLWYNQTLMVETNRVSGMYGTMLVELHLQRTIQRSEMCALHMALAG